MLPYPCSFPLIFTVYRQSRCYGCQALLQQWNTIFCSVYQADFYSLTMGGKSTILGSCASWCHTRTFYQCIPKCIKEQMTCYCYRIHPLRVLESLFRYQIKAVRWFRAWEAHGWTFKWVSYFSAAHPTCLGSDSNAFILSSYAVEMIDHESWFYIESSSSPLSCCCYFPSREMQSYLRPLLCSDWSTFFSPG